MKIESKILEWDTNFFGFNVCNLDVSQVSHEDLLSILAKIDAKVCYVNSLDSFDVSNVFSYKGSKVIFEKRLNKELINDFSKIVYVDSTYYNKNLTQFRQLAYISGSYSRFKVDAKFKLDIFRRLYDNWLDKAMQKSFDNFFIAFVGDDNTPKGFLTAKIDKLKKKTDIGLIAVSNESQGKGIGRILLQFLELYCFDNKIETIKIVTQLENSNACRFYEKMGYKQIDIKYVYHYWK